MQRDANRPKGETGANESAGVKKLVVPKDPWGELRSLEGVGQRPEGVGKSTSHDQDEALRAAPAVDLRQHGHRGPPDDQIGQRIHPLRGVNRPLADADPDHGSGDHDEQQDQSNGPVHREPRESEVTTGNGEKDGRVVRTLEGSAMARRPANTMKERTGDEHRFDAHDVTEDPANLAPRVSAREQQR